jgi:hypothetical protein
MMMGLFYGEDDEHDDEQPITRSGQHSESEASGDESEDSDGEIVQTAPR